MREYSRRSALGLLGAAITVPVLAGEAVAVGNSTPVMVSLPADTWTQVNSANPNWSYWNTDRHEGAKVGYAWDGTARYRSFFQASIAALRGATVHDARFEVWLDHSPTGQPTPVDLFYTAPISPAIPLTWNNSGGHWRHHLATVSGNAWSGAGQPDQLLSFSGALTSAVQHAVFSDEGVVSLGLKAPDEANRYQWKRFRSADARLVVTYTPAA
ncbi:hypothetical protein [Kribbella deserti]|uniref:Tat pathway signal sequence domain protein n=1 Tax=Kribbella deserti TaxID=1926257 RepID=A0ABV6QJL7_9ACTN